MNSSLKNKKIKIIFEDQEEISCKYKTTVEEALIQNKTEDEMSKILAVKFNNEIKTFEQQLVNNGKMIPVRYDTRDGQRIYMRTVKFILFMALRRTYPNLEIEFSNNINDNGYFICTNDNFDSLMAVHILKEMRQIVKNASKIERKVVSYEEARALYTAVKDETKLESFDIKLDSYITMYFCEDMYNSMYGALAPNTSLVPDFDIKVFRKGFLVINKEESIPLKSTKELKDNKIYDIFEKYSKYSEYTGIKSVSDLNEKIIDDQTEDVIKVSEAIQGSKMAELISDISNRQNLKVILIAGPSSSGKTTFAEKLGINLKLLGYKPVCIGMDDYYRNMQDRYIDSEHNYDSESVAALDIDLFNQNIKSLLEGKKIKTPKYDFVTGKRVFSDKTLKLEKNDVLIIEGIHALNPIISNLIEDKYKYKIYIAPITTLNLDDYSKISSTDTRIIRRLVRDYNTRGLKVEKTFSMWSDVMKGEKTYIYPFVETADYIFNTSLIYELGALKTFADPLLLQVSAKNEYFAEARRLLGTLKNFLPIDTKSVPADSLLREFIGKR